jgi:hypothetical protein
VLESPQREGPEPDPVQAGEGKGTVEFEGRRSRLLGSLGEEKADRFGSQAACGELQCVGALRIEPLEVVDGYGHGPICGHGPEGASSCRGDGTPIRGRSMEFLAKKGRAQRTRQWRGERG